jgi:hypothetical protein
MKKAKEAATQYQANATIALTSDILAQLREAAEWNGVPLEKAALDAVLSYIGRYGRAKVEKEQAIFEQRKPELLKRYRGQYIAMHNGDVVETAADLRTLRSKVFARFGHTPMLHTFVTDQPDPEVVIRSPRLVRQ